eukprot:TRINITY_DN11836_c0_g1_i1.p1 TRINITY_DN11836_c0_g1~~TRINITY_DN11836_c0_g1_i1.p1  ORF type:complete len:128 (-),score=58.92 TRINITY_DN11836_c0_g1_i1:32-415(-)
MCIRDRSTQSTGDYVANNTDCDDGDSAIGDGFTEVCDFKDNDCANGVDDGVEPIDYYIDDDGDGDGDGNATPIPMCPTDIRVTSGDYVVNSDDCADDDALTSLGGTCLLYTSPSPRDRTRYRMPSSA